MCSLLRLSLCFIFREPMQVLNAPRAIRLSIFSRHGLAMHGRWHLCSLFANLDLTLMGGRRAKTPRLRLAAPDAQVFAQE